MKRNDATFKAMVARLQGLYKALVQRDIAGQSA